MIAGKRVVCIVALLVLGSMGLYAELASGPYAHSFDAGLWDISGHYNDEVAGTAMDFSLVTDPGGKVTGQGTASMSEAGSSLSLNLLVNGTIASSGKAVRVNLTLKMNGSGYVQGYYCTFTATATEKMEIDPQDNQLVGYYSGKVTVSVPSLHKKASSSIPRTEQQEYLPSDANGLWDLTVNSSAARNKYTGSAAISLDNGRILPLTLTGSFTPKTDVSKFTLKGQGLNRSVSLSLTACCANAQLNLKSLTGKALGQTLRLPASHP